MLSIFDHGGAPACPAPFNLAAYVLAQADRRADKDALIVADAAAPEHWNYARLQRAVLGTATGLLRAGLGPGDMLLMRLGNTVDFPIVYLGAIAAGIVPVPTSAQLTVAEVRRLIDFLTPAAILQAPQVACPDHPARLSLADAQAWRDLPAASYDMGAPDRMAYVVFTSGTSGTPRAVAHAHRAIWARRMMRHDWEGLGADDRLLHAGAFNWTYTLGTGLLDPWACGATALIAPDGTPATDQPALLARFDATIFAASPGIYRRMLRDGADLSLPKLRHGLSAGEKMPPALVKAWQAVTGTQVHEAFGMSECSTFISSAPGRPAPATSLGQPQQGRRLALLGADGAPVPIGQPGIIAVHKDDPGLMLGYVGAEAATAKRYAGDWFLTGDQAVADTDFQMTYLGRDDDMINAGGLRVSPLEIERVLTQMPGITAAAAVEIRLRADTTVIGAFYTAPAKVDDAAFDAYVENKLAAYKRPRLYKRLSELPVGPNGKLLRRALRDAHATTNESEETS